MLLSLKDIASAEGWQFITKIKQDRKVDNFNKRTAGRFRIGNIAKSIAGLKAVLEGK